ncbi:high-affinity iron transporter [Leucobacter exalbidus]|uniref:High-affinity iron transporter n=1 Tax=Leucobacter exalbidus TaxID=662960 RepID=A0A940PTT2_9MICO|nr:iron uptake transporter permease EfeU [Leucobacter exalbidus]MBP1325149.1 high-affinity iron transporter [Leucobacter exalbidus]
MLGTLLIGLREGLEAALVVSVLLAWASRTGRPDTVRKIWLGVGSAVALSLIIGATLTYGAYGLSFRAQEIIGGTLSIVAVIMVTWMVFWMLRAAKGFSGELHSKLERAGTGWGIAAIGFISVGREGIETALFIWATTRASDVSPLVGFVSAVSGILVAVLLSWALFRGMIRINLTRFFRWSGVLLIIFAAGVLAYGIHDLQEAGVLPGPFALAPAGASAFVAQWFGENAWAFRVPHLIAPDGIVATLLKGTLGFAPEMTRLEVFAWFAYLVPTLIVFLRGSFASQSRKQRAAGRADAAAADGAAGTEAVAAQQVALSA